MFSSRGSRGVERASERVEPTAGFFFSKFRRLALSRFLLRSLFFARSLSFVKHSPPFAGVPPPLSSSGDLHRVVERRGGRESGGEQFGRQASRAKKQLKKSKRERKQQSPSRLASRLAHHLSTRSNARFCVSRPEPSLRPLEFLLSPPEPGRAIAAAGVVVVAAAAASTPPPTPSRLDGRCNIGAAAADIRGRACVRVCVCGGESVGETALCSTGSALFRAVERGRKRKESKINGGGSTCRFLLF